MHNINSISNVDVNCKFHVNYKLHTISFRCRGLSGLKLWGGGGGGNRISRKLMGRLGGPRGWVWEGDVPPPARSAKAEA